MSSLAGIRIRPDDVYFAVIDVRHDEPYIIVTKMKASLATARLFRYGADNHMPRHWRGFVFRGVTR
jgi:hypothetical protein